MHFPSPALSRFAVFTATVILIADAAGAFITSTHQASLALPPWITGNGHALAGLAAGILSGALAIWLAPSNTRLFVRAMSWVAVVAFIGDAASSLGITNAELPPGMSILHAALAPLFFACVIVVAVFTQPELIWDPEFIDIHERRWLRTMALLTPVAVLIQIVLGASYRHKVFSIMPHMGGAMVVALLLLVLCIQIMQQYPSHATLRPMAITAMSVLLVQILLGIVAFLMQLLDFDMSMGFVILSVAHVITGSLVFAASLIFAIEFHRCLPRADADEKSATVAPG